MLSIKCYILGKACGCRFCKGKLPFGAGKLVKVVGEVSKSSRENDESTRDIANEYPGCMGDELSRVRDDTFCGCIHELGRVRLPCSQDLKQ